jgi:phenylalanyl-tRNA synthetase alpha chain
MGLQDEIPALRAEALAAFSAAARDVKRLEEARIKYLGVNGRLKAFMKRLKEVPKEEKPAAGKLMNELSKELEAAFDSAKARAGTAAPTGPREDVTEPLPPELRPALGRRHPLTRTTDSFRDLLRALGFEVVEGPEVEDERHNFDDLNVPQDHPARDSFDTFFLTPKPGARLGEALLRSQTSTVQIRLMEARRPPLRVIAPGRCYRPDKIDATHASTFHQIEGLYVDRGVSMADLKGTLQLFAEGLFGAGTRVRFRPSFFPFTEPSAEMDCSCPACGGSGCSICKQTGWVELGGCGMVDPNVFEAVNRARGDRAYDPEVWTGFAFGFGIERMAMRRHGITDIRLFLENDLRFLKQV